MPLLTNLCADLGKSNTDMRKIIITLSLLFVCLWSGSALQAQSLVRTSATKVGDALNQLPATEEALFARLMEDLLSTGKEGIIMLADMTAPAGEALPQVEYALDGMVLYATRPEQSDSLRNALAENLAAGLERVKDNYNKAFFIRQLQMLGQDVSVDVLKPYLSVEALSAPAAEALTAIGTKQAVQALLSVPLTKQTINNLAQIGDITAERDLAQVLTNGPEDLKNDAYYALGLCGTMASANLLKNGPVKDYLTLLRRMWDGINTKQMIKAVKPLLKNATSSEDRCDALDFMLELRQESGMNYVMEALKCNDGAYRRTALNRVATFTNAAINSELLRALPSLDSAAAADLIEWFGNLKNDILIPYIQPYLDNENNEVAQAAAWALVQTGGETELASLAAQLKSDDSFKVSLAKDCLKSFAGNIVPEVVSVYAQASEPGKVAALELLSLRKARAEESMVIGELKNSSAAIRTAAAKALTGVADPAHRAQYYTLLENASESDVPYFQEAILATMEGMEPAQQFALLSAQMATVPAAKQSLYYRPISKTDIKQALDLIGTRMPTDDYIRMITLWDAPGAQKLLFLRNALDVQKDPEQQAELLKAIGKTNTFLGVIACGAYLNSAPKTAQAAAMSIYTLAVNNPSFHSAEVSGYIKQAMNVLTEAGDPDVIYYKQNVQQYFDNLPKDEGFVSMFNGKDISQWQGLVGNPISRAAMKPAALAKAQKEADDLAFSQWIIDDGVLVFLGKGKNLCSKKTYGDFEMYVDWMLDPNGEEPDAGIYLRGAPQVQIWDTSRVDVDAQVGSGGLYNNKKHQDTPTHVADNKLGQWNSFYIKMVGERVTVYLNGDLVVDNVIMENYWDRNIPIFSEGPVELQAHGSKVSYRNIYIKEIPSVKPIELSAQEKEEGFEMLFDGTNMHKWMGNTTDYVTEDGVLAVHPTEQGFGDLYTIKEYGDFIFRFEFKLTPGANNGVGIRTPGVGDAAYVGMEIQILDHYDPIYQPWLKAYQYHGSVYGVIPTQNRDAFRPVGEWNQEEIYAKGNYIRVTLNGVVITEGDISSGPIDNQEHPGLFNKQGKIGFLGHGSELWFRNIRVKEL